MGAVENVGEEGEVRRREAREWVQKRRKEGGGEKDRERDEMKTENTLGGQKREYKGWGGGCKG